jgi:phage-related protein
MPTNREAKPLFFMGSSKDDLRAFPEEVKDVMGFALRIAQLGGKHKDAKPLRGFGSAGVLEIIDDDDGDTYRGIYTVRFEGVVYMLHAFQKKSKRGIETPKSELALVKKRLKAAEDHYERTYRKKK